MMGSSVCGVEEQEVSCLAITEQERLRNEEGKRKR